MDHKSSQPDSQEQNQLPTQPAASISLESLNNFTPKFVGVIVGLLILGGLVYGGIWFWNDKNKEAVVPTFTPRVIDETAGWQTYRNEEYGFGLKYPSDWKFSQNFSYVDGFFFTKDKSTFSVLPKGGFDHGLPGIPDRINDESVGDKMVKVSDWLKTNLTFVQFIDNSIPSSWIVCKPDLKNCNRLYLHADNQSDMETMSRIISTFKFTNSVDTSTWKTYRNEQYGFEIKLPYGWNIEEKSFGLDFTSPEKILFLQENEKNCLGQGTGECIVHGLTTDLSFSNSAEIDIDIEEYGPDRLGEKIINSVKFRTYPILGIVSGIIYETVINEKIYHFEIYEDQTKGLQILSTFRFIE